MSLPDDTHALVGAAIRLSDALQSPAPPPELIEELRVELVRCADKVAQRSDRGWPE
jgi:hypothetical protein